MAQVGGVGREDLGLSLPFFKVLFYGNIVGFLGSFRLFGVMFGCLVVGFIRGILDQKSG